VRLGIDDMYNPLRVHFWLFACAPLIAIPLFMRVGMYRAVMMPFAIIKAVSLSSLILALVVYWYSSVIPLFHRQIKTSGPLTVTHPEITRYFMTIPEAAQLVIQAGSVGQGDDVFVLDMGEPVRIVELVEKMIHFFGLSVRFEKTSW